MFDVHVPCIAKHESQLKIRGVFAQVMVLLDEEEE